MFSVKAEPSTNIINVEFDVLIELELACSSRLFFAQYYAVMALLWHCYGTDIVMHCYGRLHWLFLLGF